MSSGPNRNVTSRVTATTVLRPLKAVPLTDNWRGWGSESPILPLLSATLAAILIISRRPDAVLHARFWAEDGAVYYSNVYNHGLLASLTVPQAGYFQTFPLLAAQVARLVAVPQAPFVMNALALAVQVLPVGILMSRRAVTLSPDLRLRAMLALLYLVVPSAVELDATAVNAQWYLAVAALLVLLLAPPKHARGRFLDGAILLMAGLTGPFCVLLAPIAWVQRRLRGPAVVPNWEPVLLSVCAILQVASLLVISHQRFGGLVVEPRPHPALGATPALFAKLVGGRLLLGSTFGAAHGLAAPLALQWIALALGLVGLASVARWGRHELRLAVVFAAFLLAGALWSPSSPSPAWPNLASGPIDGQRYFFIPQLAVLAGLVWAAASVRRPVVRIAAATLVAVSLGVAFSGHWSYPAFVPTGFPAKAAAFERAPAGTVAVFALNPPPWVMSLTKR
jgi:hypothetical protein